MLKLKYWNETLENIIKDQRNDKFKIIVNNTVHEVPLSFALGISPFITEEYLKDPTFKELNIRINNNTLKEEEIKKEFGKFIKGEEISSEIFYEIGNVLKNKEMLKEWNKNQKITKETINKMIQINHKLYDKTNIKGDQKEIENMKEVLEYIGEHFEELKNEIQELTNEEIIFILKNDKIKVEKEDIIWEFVKERIKNQSEMNIKNKRDKSMLLGIIECKHLNKESFKEYIDMIEEEDIQNESIIFRKIREILINNLDNLHLEEDLKRKMKDNIMNINHQEGKNFEGIINHFQNQSEKRILEQGIISITASSVNDSCGPEHLIEYDSNSYYYSNNNAGNWIEINFKEKKVKINGYSLRTYGYGYNGYNLKNWVIEGSKDKNQWIEIDKKENNFDLNGSSFEHHFPISKSTDAFQYIRLRSIGLNHYGNNHIILTKLELYGEIITNSK